jgi:two-component system, NtrC family, sensor histidine kinase HydH
MSENAIGSRSWFGIRIQDALLILMFGALIVLAHQNLTRFYLASIAFLQLIEGRVTWLDLMWGRVTSIVLQLLIWWLLMDNTGWLGSQYYPLLLLPVVSTATYLGVTGTMVTSVAAIAAYLSLLLRAEIVEIPPEAIHTLAINCVALAVAALIVNLLGEARRTEATRYKRAAEQLATANQNLREAEAAVRRSERLAALGQLSAGLAHELRNPLGSIRGSAELLERSVGGGDNPVARELAGIISEEVDRTNSLVTRFLDFARPLEPRREVTDITQVIDQAARHARVEIIRNYSPDVPSLPIDPSLMEQVFINLLSNAAQASTPDAPITVLTRVMRDEAEICVVDRGCGISPDKIETIFNPFVTTKQTGVGLGLAIVAKIVDGHGGRMSVESEPGKGSTFRLFLPLEEVAISVAPVTK